MMTTSASCLSATPRATVAPTLPAPPTTVTLRFMPAPAFVIACLLHVLDHSVPERRRLQLGRAVHQPREVVGYPPGGNRALHALDDQIGLHVPPEVAQHHLAREDHRSGIHFVLIRIFRRGAMR